MTEKSISFRAHLQSNTTDLLTNAGIECTHTVRLVTGLVSMLAAYTEEGTPLSPSVFICNSISDLLKMSGVGEHVPLSAAVDTGGAASRILKFAAPLCGGGWSIYVEREGDGRRCKFGVFCGSNDPSSLTVDEVVLGEPIKDFPVVRVAQNVVNKVEVRTSNGSAVEFRFNDDADIEMLNNRSQVANLASAASRDLETPDASFTGFMDRILSSSIRDSHGTLIAVVPRDLAEIPEALSDSVKLDEPINLYERYKLHMEENRTAVSVSRLQVASKLLSGFINSDGITILDSGGQVLGYRAFIKSADADTPATGGARTRAYAALSALVGNGLSGAFFRSQDGRMDSNFIPGT
ncbi:hypothetical protein RJJ63_13905 [Rhizobium hidalgonense]|uniref:hypothetical protein n=1 Tax=Rhizobium hidalgonense TaxID=1538159 RepID=UPI0028724707|nr:hypothetical protein [Rhizobium hidalgonense]MDR9820388.1 hypothetical protein [Rhizobium hidalgonense]